MDISVDKLHCPRIVVICPGKDGHKDGYNRKYVRLAELIVSNQLSAVVRMSNPNKDDKDREINLRECLEYISRNSESICGYKSPQIIIVGVSAGARSALLLCPKYRSIVGVIMVEPALPHDAKETEKSINLFDGKMLIIIGGVGNALDTKTAKEYLGLASQDKTIEVIQISTADHYFSGDNEFGKLESIILEKIKTWL